jgi:hypothetical protein
MSESSPQPVEFRNRITSVRKDLFQQAFANVSPCMHRHSHRATVGLSPQRQMTASLADLDETLLFQEPHQLPGGKRR